MSGRLVLDASAAVRVVMVAEGASAVADALGSADVVMVPGLFAIEVASALWKYGNSGQVEAEEAISLLEKALDLADVEVPDRELATEALATATRLQHPVYDLMYAVLARRHGCAVCTFDKRLRRLLKSLSVPVLP